MSESASLFPDLPAESPEQSAFGILPAQAIRAFVASGVIAADPFWERHRGQALKAGLNAAWSTPIKAADDGVVAIMREEVGAKAGLARIQQEGRVFLSGTRIAGETWLRCAILSFRTHLAHIGEIIDVLARTAAALRAE